MKLAYRRILRWLRPREGVFKGNSFFSIAEELETRRLLSALVSWPGISSPPGSAADNNAGLRPSSPSAPQATGYILSAPVPTKLAFLETPAAVSAGQTIAPAITVAVEDSSGHVVTTDSSTITLHLATGPAGGKLTGSLHIPVINGLATFTDLAFTKPGDFTLEASDGSLVSATSGSITAAASATHLVIVQQPTTTVAGQDISPLAVVVEDASGHIVTTDNSSVTVTIPDGANTLGGTTTVHAINGSAVFTDLVIIGAGKYTFTATDGTLASASSRPFTITPDVSSSQLFIKQQPAINLIGRPLFPSVLVSVNDQFGNLITTDHSAITLSIFSGPQGATLSGTTSSAAKNGIATFKNVIPSVAGGYVLHADDPSLQVTTALSINATVSRAISSAAAPKVASAYAAGQTVNLNAAIKSSAPSSVPFTGTIAIVDQDNTTLGTAAITAGGTARFSLTGLVPGVYTCTVSYPGDANHTAVVSPTFTLNVLQAAAKTSLKASASQVAAGQSFTLTAAISSGGSVAPSGTVTFFDNGAVLGTPTTVDSSGTATLVIATPAAGAHSYTAVYSGDSQFASSTSGAARVTVKGVVTRIALAPGTPGHIPSGTLFDLTATVTVPATDPGTPTGPVVFMDNATPIGTVTLNSAGVATLTGLTYTAPGHHTLLAIYSGDTFDNPANSPRLTLIAV